MSRRHRRKDVAAVVVILGAAVVYWMNRTSPQITFDDRRSAPGAQQPEPADRVTTLPGLETAE